METGNSIAVVEVVFLSCLNESGFLLGQLEEDEDSVVLGSGGVSTMTSSLSIDFFSKDTATSTF